jgi:type II secretory pathway component PulJ
VPAAKRPTVRVGESPSVAGFLLLEVLTALLIAALTLAVLTRSATESRNALHVALKNEEAVVRARSRLAALDHVGLLPGQRQGDDGGGFTWITKVVPLATSAAMNGRGAQFVSSSLPHQTLYAVTVIIDWPEADIVHRFVLPTERIGSALQESP